MKKINFDKKFVGLIAVFCMGAVLLIIFLRVVPFIKPVKVVPTLTPIPTPVKPKRPISEFQATFSFAAPKKELAIGETLKVAINLDTGKKKVSGATAIISFDPAMLEIVDSTPGKIFPVYPQVLLEEENKRLVMSGLIITPGQPGFSGSGQFGEIEVRAKKKGKTFLNFVVSQEMGAANDSNVIEEETAFDVLRETVDLELWIK